MELKPPAHNSSDDLAEEHIPALGEAVLRQLHNAEKGEATPVNKEVEEVIALVHFRRGKVQAAVVLLAVHRWGMIDSRACSCSMLLSPLKRKGSCPR